ncbi:TPA: hypothetical protein ACH3X1_013233 [Trebouxia sp. C0004]
MDSRSILPICRNSTCAWSSEEPDGMLGPPRTLASDAATSRQLFLRQQTWRNRDLSFITSLHRFYLALCFCRRSQHNENSGLHFGHCSAQAVCCQLALCTSFQAFKIALCTVRAPWPCVLPTILSRSWVRFFTTEIPRGNMSWCPVPSATFSLGFRELAGSTFCACCVPAVEMQTPSAALSTLCSFVDKAFVVKT